MQRPDFAAQMIGYLLQPLSEDASSESSSAWRSPDSPTSDLSTSDLNEATEAQDGLLSLGAIASSNLPDADSSSIQRYRLTHLLSRESGKRTFLGQDITNQTVVLVKLVLFGPDELESDSGPSELAPPDLDTAVLEAAAVMLPYLDAFEVETPLGPGLALIKPYPPTHPSVLRLMSTRFPTPSRTSRKLQSQGTGRLPKASRQALPKTLPTAAVSLPKGPVTDRAQHSYADFRLRATAQKFELHFQAARLQSGKRLATADDVDWTTVLEPWVSTILGTILFVGGSVVATGSVWIGVVVAVMLPVLYMRLVSPPVNPRERAVVRLTHESGGRTFLSLTTLINAKAGGPPYTPLESTLHSSKRVVKSVKISPTLVLSPGHSPLRYQLYFTFYNADSKDYAVRLVGSYSEVRWVCQQLTEWARNRPSPY